MPPVDIKMTPRSGCLSNLERHVAANLTRPAPTDTSLTTGSGWATARVLHAATDQLRDES